MKNTELKELRQTAQALPPMKGTNHYRRLKDAYKSGGIKAVVNYVSPFLEIRKKQLQNERTNKG
ncbi:MAG: hypothetical protein QM802_19895 [Agriterribacter sp.]